MKMEIEISLTVTHLFLGILFFLSPVSRAADVDGGWSAWSEYGSPCSATCGAATQLRHRSCTHPSPQGAGSLCLDENNATALSESKSFECNLPQCFSNDYAPWTPCTECVNGKSYMYPLCENNQLCEGETKKKLTQEKDCPGWNLTTCTLPCSIPNKCPEYGKCEDTSTEEKPDFKCKCTMGYQMNADKSACIRPPPTLPTVRPIPTLPEVQKKVATVVSKSASSLLIFFVSLTLILFGVLRIFTPDRVIQMNMEIALILAHIFLMFPPETYKMPNLCKVVSIFIHLFFTACFNFMMLEAAHMYSLVAYVVKKDGLFTRLQNIVIGWGLSIFMVGFCVAFEYDNYGGEYHCWLRMDTPLKNAQWILFILTTIVTLILTEAAGAADYEPLKNMNLRQRLSAQISQRTNLIILPFVISHMLIGMLSEYEQNLPLYGTFSLLNGITGALIFFLHCSNNQQVRAKLKRCYNSMGRRS